MPEYSLLLVNSGISSPVAESNITLLLVTPSTSYLDVTLISENSAVAPSVAKKPTVLASMSLILCAFSTASLKSALVAT